MNKREKILYKRGFCPIGLPYQTRSSANAVAKKWEQRGYYTDITRRNTSPLKEYIVWIKLKKVTK